MKHNLKLFIAGAITTALIGSLGISALAATGAISLQVTPVKVMVNNQEFKPKDAQGSDVLVFNHNGTTYAPLRGLAEAYGLQVGWDQQNQMATVGKCDTVPIKPDVPATIESYEDYKSVWQIEKYNSISSDFVYGGCYRGQLTTKELFAKINVLDENKRIEYATQLAKEVMKNNSLNSIEFETLTGDMIFEHIVINNNITIYKWCSKELVQKAR